MYSTRLNVMKSKPVVIGTMQEWLRITLRNEKKLARFTHLWYRLSDVYGGW